MPASAPYRPAGLGVQRACNGREGLCSVVAINISDGTSWLIKVVELDGEANNKESAVVVAATF